MSETNNSQMSIEEKRQRILEMIKKYWEEEDQNLQREEILRYDANVEKVYTIFSINEETERKNLLEKYQKESEEGQQKLAEEYLIQKENLIKLIQEMKKLILKFEDFRQKSYDEEEADELLYNIE